MPKRKCQWCKEYGDMDNMSVEVVGNKRKIKKYYHNSPCYDELIADKEFKAKERILKDELNELLLNIYGVKSIPNSAWALLEALRNGNQVFGNQQMGKRYKEGYEYPIIKEAFEYCRSDIEYWNGVKKFNSFIGGFKYALTIVIDKIYFVEQRMIDRKKKQDMISNHIDNLEMEEDYGEFKSSYKKDKKKNNVDISDFLDD